MKKFISLLLIIAIGAISYGCQAVDAGITTADDSSAQETSAVTFDTTFSEVITEIPSDTTLSDVTTEVPSDETLDITLTQSETTESIDTSPVDTSFDDPIKQAYYEYKKESGSFPKPTIPDYINFGTYADSVVVLFREGTAQVFGIDTVAGIKIGYPDGNRLLAYNGGKIYKLQAAYDSGILTIEDIQSIAYIQNRGYIL